LSFAVFIDVPLFVGYLVCNDFIVRSIGGDLVFSNKMRRRVAGKALAL